MKITNLYSTSITRKLVKYLFEPKKIFVFSESRIGTILSYFINERLAEICIYISVALVLYQKLIPNTFSGLAPAILIIGLMFTAKRKIVITKSILWLLIFYTLMTISLMFSFLGGLSPKMLLMGFLLYLQFGLYLIAGKSISSKRLYYYITLIVAPISVFGIYQFFTTDMQTVLWVSEFENISFRAFSIVGDPNIFGMLSVVGLITTFILLMEKKKWFAVLLPIYSVAVALSYSRTAWLGLLFAALLYIAINHKKLLWFSPLGLLILLVPKVRERVLVVFNPNFIRDSSVDGRIWILNNVVHIWKKSPIFGFGPGSYGGEIALRNASPVYTYGMQNGYVPIYYTDGQWLQVLVQGGLVGILALMGFFVASATEMYHNWKQRSDFRYIGGMMIVVFVIIAGFTSNILEFGTVIIPCSLLIGSALSES